MTETLIINEIYLSLQGESTFIGLPCVFVRLAACDLRCSYCDTAYAFRNGQKWELPDVLRRVEKLAAPFGPARGGKRLPLVELTGGEPLLQSNSLSLMQALCDSGFEVLLETSGAHDISTVDGRVHRIMDLKCPGSGEVRRNRRENLACLKRGDEVKFVIGSVEDYEWAKAELLEHRLAEICPVLFSWAEPLSEGQRDPSLKVRSPGHTDITRRELAERIIADALSVRFQVQMHKVIWAPDAKGV